MIKYYVDDIKGHRIYEGFDEATAYRLCRQYNENCGGTYDVREIDTDLDDFEELDENHYVFCENRYLTALYGSDDCIKDDIKMAIEHETGKEIIDFDLHYNDPGDSGNEATFWANNIKWKPRKSRIKYKSFLVRDGSDYNSIYFIIKLEDEKYWQEAKEYMDKKREEDATYDYMDDQSIMEEYWQKSNINYQIIDLPDNELYL